VTLTTRKTEGDGGKPIPVLSKSETVIYKGSDTKITLSKRDGCIRVLIYEHNIFPEHPNHYASCRSDLLRLSKEDEGDAP